MRYRIVKTQRFQAAACGALMMLDLLAGCGGGGGGGGGAAAAAAATSTATPSASAVAATATPTASPQATPTSSPSATLLIVASPTSTTVIAASPTSTPTAVSTDTPVVCPPGPSPSPVTTPSATSQPAPTATATALTGPLVTAFGVADASGTYNARVDRDSEKRSIFSKKSGAGFIIYIEGRPGVSRFPVGTIVLNSRAGDPSAQPDLQVLSANDLGTPTATVCDSSFGALGGVPHVDPPDFGGVQSVSDALNDLACRFKVYSETDFACTQDCNPDNRGTLTFCDASSTIQFCTLVNDAFPFPSGDTLLTARLRDIAGRVGPPTQIIVRITAAN